MTDDSVPLPLDEQAALAMFVDLEEFVVSFDRILSRIGAGADPAILTDYVAERDVLRRIANARRVLGDLLEARIGAAEVEAIAERGYHYTDPPPTE